MKYEVVEQAGEWIVQLDGVELGRFGRQDDALCDIAHRLREAGHRDETISLSMRYAGRA